MGTKVLACPECRHIVEVQTGNPGWWLKSNNELKAKNKKARVDRKEARYETDPALLQKEIDRLKHLEAEREAGGSQARTKRKLEELSEVKAESERRRQAAAAEAAGAPAPREPARAPARLQYLRAGGYVMYLKV